jgi:hypothetical protein
MKRCFKCGKEKGIDEFYKHPAMGDGHLGKCIECAKRDVKERADRLSQDQSYIIKERKRGREKYYRLGYREKHKTNSIDKKISMKKYIEKYPEKQRARCVSQKIKAPDGLEKHHWSYSEKHNKDVLFLTVQDHSRLHRYMIYDQERMMYRTTDGVLLDSREKHEKHLELTKTMD